MVNYRITPEGLPNSGILYVDHEAAHRSGHLSHALVEYFPGKVLSFYSNCAANRNNGHNGFGWIEYRRSVDAGRTWGVPQKLEYSMHAFLNEPYRISCEKAVSVYPNEIILFCTRTLNPNGWEPYDTPMYLKSTDSGVTWREMGQLSHYPGRIYDAIVKDGIIYVLELCSPADENFVATKPEHKYRIFSSADWGETFVERGVLPGNVLHRGYGAMELTPDGALICYTYNIDDEYNLDYYISPDFGRSWTEIGRSFCAKRIRNPQVARVRGGYILHGRSGCMTNELPSNFVLYTSEDGIHWDEGVYLCEARGWGGASFYSNNLVLNGDGGRQTVLIQSSVAYDSARTNIAHWYLEIE